MAEITDDMKVADVDWGRIVGARIKHAVEWGDLPDTVKALRNMTDAELIRTPNFGLKCFRAVREKIGSNEDPRTPQEAITLLDALYSIEVALKDKEDRYSRKFGSPPSDCVELDWKTAGMLTCGDLRHALASMRLRVCQNG